MPSLVKIVTSYPTHITIDGMEQSAPERNTILDTGCILSYGRVMVKTHTLSVRIDDDVKDGMERAAEVERRTIGSLVNKILADWIAANAPKKGRK